MHRPQRLLSARSWLLEQKGRPPQRICTSYRRRYGVDWQCAIAELTTLGLSFDPQWLQDVERSLQRQHRARAAQRAARAEKEHRDLTDGDSNEYFALIAGYTPGWIPVWDHVGGVGTAGKE